METMNIKNGFRRIIEIESLVKVYRTGVLEVTALRGISFNVDVGEFVAIMGQSGSGKSTLMNIIGCLDSLTTGRYHLDGEDVSSLAGKRLASIRNKKLGFVFQSYNLLPRLNALQNVELPMVYTGVSAKKRRQAALAALDRVGLSDRIHHLPSELSGGQKQRVAIARALVNTPALLLADEPTGNLDSRSGEEIMAIFQRLNKEGVTIVMVTHEPEIAHHTNRIIMFKDGLIVSDVAVESPTIALGPGRADALLGHATGPGRADALLGHATGPGRTDALLGHATGPGRADALLGHATGGDNA